MAKGQLSEEELRGSLPELGNVSALQPRKRSLDSPFRRTTAEPLSPPQHQIEQSNEPVEGSPQLSVSNESAFVAPSIEPVDSTPVRRDRRVPAATKKPQRMPSSRESISNRKADIYRENVTLPMSEELREGVSHLARALQRQRLRKEERFTPNSVMRVFIEAGLASFRLRPEDVVNAEKELLELVIRSWRGS